MMIVLLSLVINKSCVMIILISMPELENKLDSVFNPTNCAEIRTFHPITNVHVELKSLSSLNALGYI